MDKQIQVALDHFQKVDPILFAIAKKIDLEQIKLRKSTDFFQSLCYEIIGQQLSGKAASTIFSRFKKLFPDEKVNPEKALKISEQNIRNAGTSWSKAKFIKNLAQKIADKELDLKTITELDNQQIIAELTKVKGIGPWTAEMFLMFTLGREDAFSVKDLGLRKAIIKLYSLNPNTSHKEIEEIASKWSPHRTYASRILWKSLEL